MKNKERYNMKHTFTFTHDMLLLTLQSLVARRDKLIEDKADHDTIETLQQMIGCMYEQWDKANEGGTA